jgi:hypothetical protein
VGRGITFAVGGAGMNYSTPLFTLRNDSTPMKVKWKSVVYSYPNRHTLTVEGSVDCTGYMDYNATFEANPNPNPYPAAEVLVNAEAVLTLLPAPSNTHFGMGLGKFGGMLCGARF